MKHTTKKIDAVDGTRLHVEQWEPAGEVRFVVVLAHGGSEHVGRYQRLAAEFVELGGLCFGPDHRGQGLSGGTRGHVESFVDFASDLRHVMLEVAHALPQAQRPESIPWFVFGHSMGGLITLTYLLEHQYDIGLRGALISAPLLGLTMKVNPVKAAVGHLAAAFLPKFSLPSGIPEDAICRDAEEVARYSSDTRRATVVTAGFFAAMNQAIARVERNAARIELPCLWYVGTGDKICDHTATVRVFESIENAAARDQTLRLFDGYYHELHNEPEDLRRPVVEMLTGWVEQRVAEPAVASESKASAGKTDPAQATTPS